MPTKFVVIVVIAVVSGAAGKWTIVGDWAVVDTVALGLLAILAGTCISAAMFIGQSVDDMRKQALYAMSAVQPLSKPRWKAIEKLCDDTRSEIKEDTLLVLYATLAVAAMVVYARLDVPRASWPQCVGLSKSEAIHAVTYASALLSFCAVKDTVSTMFGLYQAIRQTEQMNDGVFARDDSDIQP